MNNFGYMTVATGPMRSRKTLDLIIEADKSEIIGIPTFIFYPAGAERWGDTNIVSSRVGFDPDGNIHKFSHEAMPISKNLDNIMSMIPSTQCFVGFDDAQFFTNRIVDITRKLRLDGHRVFVSGLDMDCFLQPFGAMPFLMAIADEVVKHTAICVDCKDPAQLTFRTSKSDLQELIGDEEYIPVCFDCYKYRLSKVESDNY